MTRLISTPAGHVTNIVDVLVGNAGREPGRTAFRFAGPRAAHAGADRTGAGADPRSLTCRDLDRRARVTAARLREEAPAGARALVLVPTGPDFVAALCGCLYAGLCAVPCEPPALPDAPGPARWAAVGRDADVAVVVTTAATIDGQRRRWAEEGGPAVAWLAVDAPPAEDDAPGFVPAAPAAGDLAMLLYTSGSTGSPKGVMISHGNVMGALAAFRAATEIPDGATVVQWIPVHHSLGMGGHVLFSQFIGGQCVILNSEDVAARPAEWLAAISRAEGPVLSGGPNFIYDRCLRAVADEEIDRLDLSGWHTALNGAERTRRDTVEGFTERFARCGFRPGTLVPIFGLTETTLLVSARRGPDLLKVAVDGAALERGEVREVAPERADDGSARVLVGSGYPALGADVRVVDPDTHAALEPGRVGEVWIQGPSVSPGYWRQEEDNARTFGARLTTGEGPYLRTGDLAFVHRGEVVVCGRLKELLIIRGRNLHPQDIEATARELHPALAAMPAAAFSVDGSDGERLVLVQAVGEPAPGDLRELAESVRRAVTAAHRVDTEVLLVDVADVPRTAAGKVRRTACRQLYLEGRLPARATSVPGAGAGTGEVSGDRDAPATGALLRLDPGLPFSAVESAVRRHVGETLGTAADGDAPLASLGLDSLRALELRHRLESDFGVTLPLADILANPVGEVARELRRRVERGEQVDPGRPVMKSDPDHRYEPFPMTDLQRAYLVGRGGDYELGDVSAHYFSEYDAEDLDVPRLVRALERLVERHEMLRAVVHADGTQRILPRLYPADGPEEPRLPYRCHDMRGRAEAEVREHLDAVRAEMSHQVLPLDAGPLFELRVTLLDGGRTRVHLSVDLLIADVRSIQIFLSEWERLYRGEELPPVPEDVSFRDYVIAAADERSGADYRRSRDYWTARLPTLPGAPDLPLVQEARTTARNRIRLERRVAAADWDRIRERAASYGVTPSAVLLAVYAVVLGAWSRTGRFAMNIPLFNRLPLHEEIGLLIGDFTSIVLLEVDLTEGEPGIAALAGRIQRRLWADMDHRHFSGVEVLREVVRRDGGSAGTPAPIVFASGRGQGEGHLPGGWLGTPVHAISQTPQVWLDHQVYEKDGDLLFNWDLVEGLFPEGVVEEMFAANCRLLEGLAADESGWTSAPGSLVPGRQRELVARANGTSGAVPDGLLFSGFAEWAVREPERRAVFAGGRWFSYGEVFAQACRVARRLRGLGVGPGQLVAVVADKGAAQVVGALGVLLAGGGYLPIDPDLPTERRDFLLDHGQAKVVVTDAASAARDWPDGVRPVAIDLDDGTDLDGGVPEQVSTPDDVAYVIYTSGSTGRPKGVAVAHRAALNTCVDVNSRFGVGPEDRVLGLSSLSFDLSVWDVFGVLGAGGGLVLPEAGARRDPGRWLELAVEHEVTVWNSVPALMQMFVEHAAGAGAVPPIRLVLMSGDWIPVDLPDRIHALAPGARVVSLGGATEAGIWSIFHEVDRVDPGWESIPYGRPLANQSFQVVNDRLEPCPVWVTGELFIGGAGLAEGYWRDPDKTAGSFITHPRTGERLYRTGDLGRWRPEGWIEFLGREDFQVKVGGFRIELGEIEAVAVTHEGVRTAVAVAAGADRHHRRLVAYVVPEPGAERGPAGDARLVEQVRALMAARLPDYMVPASIVVLDSLPLTANGKVDRTALPDPAVAAGPAPENDGASAESDVEHAILAVLKQVSGRDAIGVTTNFFDIGIDSVVMVRVHRMLRTALNRNFPLTALFGNPNIRSLAAHLGGTGDGDQAIADAYARAQDRRDARRRRVRRPDRREGRA